MKKNKEKDWRDMGEHADIGPNTPLRYIPGR